MSQTEAKDDLTAAAVSGYVGQFCRGCANKVKRPQKAGGFFYGCHVRDDTSIREVFRSGEGCDLAVVHGNPGVITMEGFTPNPTEESS